MQNLINLRSVVDEKSTVDQDNSFCDGVRAENPRQGRVWTREQGEYELQWYTNWRKTASKVLASGLC